MSCLLSLPLPLSCEEIQAAVKKTLFIVSTKGTMVKNKIKISVSCINVLLLFVKFNSLEVTLFNNKYF